MRLARSWIGIVIRAVRFWLITEGAGYYQERGKPARVVRMGDVIQCAPGVEHWHGATPNSGFAYLPVTPTQKGKTIWLEPVSDKDYNSAK
jgi:quercetin dioxygenase-like cupin family protein